MLFFLQIKKSDGTYDIKYTLSGAQGNAWKKTTILIGNYRNFVIIFSGKRGANYRGDIAIDDISFKNCYVDVKRNCTPNEVCEISLYTQT